MTYITQGSILFILVALIFLPIGLLRFLVALYKYKTYREDEGD